MATRRITPGTGQLNLEIELSLLQQLRSFVRERNEKIRHVVELALRRHMDYPPPPPKPPDVLPLPPVPAKNPTSTATTKPAKKARTAKKPK